MFSAHTQKCKYLVCLFCFVGECILILKILRHCLWFLSPILFHFLTLLGVAHFKLHVFKFFSHNFYYFLSLSCTIRNFFQFTILFFRCFNPYTEVSFLNFRDCIFYLVLFQTSVFHTIFFTASWLVSSPLIISCSGLWYYLFLSLNILNTLALKYSTWFHYLYFLNCRPFSVLNLLPFFRGGLFLRGFITFALAPLHQRVAVPQVCRPPCRVVLYLRQPGSSRCHWD